MRPRRPAGRLCPADRPSLSPRYIVNGRFLGQRTTGVQRVASCLLQALDPLVPSQGGWQVLVPSGCAAPPWRRLRVVQRGQGGGHLWEQWTMSRASAQGRVINIAGSGPWFGEPQVCWLHDAAVFDHPDAYRSAFVGWYQALFRRRERRGDLLISPSYFARDRLAAHLGVDCGRIEVLPHGADHLDAIKADGGALQRLGLLDDVARGGFWLAVASANPNKNLDRLVKAHRSLHPSRRLRLVLAGGSNDRVFSKDPTPHDGLVHVHEPDDATLKALLRGARALVLPSLVEGFGLPAVEAMREGCAVIAARTAALPEVCGPAAEYVDPLDVADIARGLVATLDDKRLADLRELGLTHVQRMRWSTAAAGFLELLARWERTR